MRSLRFLLFLSILAAIRGCIPVFASEEWQPITPEELKMTSDPSQPGAAAIILYHEEISNDNQSFLYKYLRVKVLTEKGKEWANVEIPYYRSDIRITDVKARTITPDGTIIPFSGAVYDKTIAKGHGVKILEKSFTLSNVEVGSIIEWKYKERWPDNHFHAAHWTVQEKLFQKQAKFTFIFYSGSRYLVNEHDDIVDQVYYTTRGFNTKDIKQTRDEMHLEMSNIPAREEEEFSPPASMSQMRVDFYYGDRKMAKPDEFWKSEGKYWTKEVEKFIGNHGSIAEAANQVISPSDTPEQKVRKIYARVQQIPNFSYGRERTEKEGKPNRSVEDVLRQNGGYRDQIARLFVAMVRSVNLRAYVMRVAPRDETVFQKAVPNWRQLQGEVAIVQLGDKEVFLDPGTQYCPFGLLEWPRTGVYGVRQTASGGTEFAQTPIPEYSQAVTQRIARVKLDEHGNLSGKILLGMQGQEAVTHRIDAAKTDEVGRNKSLEDELKALLPFTATVKLDSTTGWSNPDEMLKTIYTVEIPGFASVTGKHMLLPIGLFEGNNKQPFTHAERKTPIYFPYPFREIDDVQISLPAGFQVESIPHSIPASAPLKTPYSIYLADRSASGNVLKLRRDFAMGSMVFLQTDYPLLKSFYEGVKSSDDEQAVLRPTAIAQVH